MKKIEDVNLLQVIESKLQAKTDKVRKSPETYQISDLRDIVQLNQLREKLKDRQ